jgi:hypothetical protein
MPVLVNKKMLKNAYFRCATAIARNPIIVALIATVGDKGAWVAAGRAGVVVRFDGTCVVMMVFWVIMVVSGTGAALPRWDVLPVLKTLSDPNWFDTVSLTS